MNAEVVPSNDAPPTRDDRLLAGVAYFSSLMGLWLIGPAVLYLWKRNQSRFVTFHAVQAVLLHLAMVPVGGLAIVLALFAQLMSSAVLSLMGRTAISVDGISALLALSVGVGVACLPFLALAWMGIAAMRGRARGLPVLGRWTEQILA